MCVGYMHILCHLYTGFEHLQFGICSRWGVGAGINPLWILRDDGIA